MVVAAAADNAQTRASEAEHKIAAASHSIIVQNDETLRLCNDAAEEAHWLGAVQFKAKDTAAQQFKEAFNPEVLLVLKRNADDLERLKQQHIADKEVKRTTLKKLMLWTTGKPAGSTEQELQVDAVKHGRFKWFQLPGSSITSGSVGSKDTGASSGNTSNTARAMKFWYTGQPAAASVARTFSDTPCTGDQGQQQKSVTAMLFGKNRRSSSGGGASAGLTMPGSRRGSDAGSSWRTSYDGNSASRRGSNRSSDSGLARTSVSLSQPQLQAATTAEQGVMATLATGEGPLSRSHSHLAKSGALQQEALIGRSLEIVAEDEREGRDSPQPGAHPSNVPHPALMATFNPAQQGNIVKMLAAPLRTTSPVETTSFSFGNKQDEQPHSPSLLLRGSISSRPIDSRGDAVSNGPLVRSSVQLQHSLAARIDPFDAPEPQPQPFVEQMKLEDQAMKAGKAAEQAASAGIMGAFRRSVSGAFKIGGMAVTTAPAMAPAALASAPSATGSLITKSQARSAHLLDPAGPGPLRANAGHMLLHSQSQQLMPTAGLDVEFLDLDSTTTYAKGVHDIMAGLQSEHSQSRSEPASAPSSPTADAAAQQQLQGRPTALNGDAVEDAAADAAIQAVAAMTAAATLARAMSPPRPAIHDEIMPADETVAQKQQQQLQQQISQAHAQQQAQQQENAEQQFGQRLEQQHSMARLTPFGALSPQASGQMQAPLASELQSQNLGQPGTPSSTTARSLRPSNSSSTASRRQSQATSVTSRGLPAMGQASMDILGRPSVSSTTSSRQLVSSTSMNLRLTDLYSQTSGNLTPLAAGLTGIRRVSSSSQGSRPLPPRPRTSPRSLLPENSMQSAAVPAPGVGPLTKQYKNTMQGAKKSAQMAGLATVSPREGAGRKSPWGWQALGLPTGPGAPLADPTIDPETYPQGNKYAASWGLVDAAAAAAATVTPGLSRQNSAIIGTLSRQQSQAALSRQQSQAAIQGQLSRQGSAIAQRLSPRLLQEQTPVTQQWHQQRRASNSGAAARYAHPASVTPEESPRSGRATPGQGTNTTARLNAENHGGRTLESRRISDVGSEDSAYYEVDNNSRGSSQSDYASPAGQAEVSSANNPARGAWQQQQQQPPRSFSARDPKVGGAKGASPIPQPPAFLSHRPTSAQAAVAAAWSPNKHASAIAQAPSYVPRAYGLSPETSGVNHGHGLSPRGLADPPLNTNNSSRGFGAVYQQHAQQTAYAGGYNMYAAGSTSLGARENDIYAPSRELVQSERAQQPQRQQQHQPVVTAVDIARQRSLRRSSSGGGGAAVPDQQYGAGYIGNSGMGLGVAGVPAGKAAFMQRQQQMGRSANGRHGMTAAGYSRDYE